MAQGDWNSISIVAAKLNLRHQSQFNFIIQIKEAETICVLIECLQQYAIISAGVVCTLNSIPTYNLHSTGCFREDRACMDESIPNIVFRIFRFCRI